MKRIQIIILVFTAFMSFSAYGQTDVKEIIRIVEEKRRGLESSQAEITMTIIRPEWTRSMSMKSWSKGDDYAMMLVTAPARDKGTATLKRDKEVWNWMPTIERAVKLPPSMMSQSWMGSDFTNNDLVQEVSIIDDYTHKILKDSTIQGRVCWKIEMVPHEGVAVVWGKIHAFVDKKDYLMLRSEYFDEDGYLVNILQASGIKQISGRTFAAKLEMIPAEEDGHKTVLEYQNIIFDQKIPDTFFSIQNLKQLK